MGQLEENISTSRSVADASPNLLTQGLRFIPGIALLFVVGILGKVAAQYVPHMEYVIFAIAFGALISNAVSLPKVFIPGVRTYEFWLKVGIVLMGAKFAMSSVIHIGGTGIVLVLMEICLAIFTARLLSKWAGLSEGLGSLIGVGSGICGVSHYRSNWSHQALKKRPARYRHGLIFGPWAWLYIPSSDV